MGAIIMKKIFYSIFMISALLFTSCVDLNLNPLSEGSSENWYSSASEIEMSLNDFYRSAFFPIDGTAWADDAAWRSNTQLVWNGTMTSENSTIGTRWQNYYKGIARALRILNNLEAKGDDLGLSDTKLQQYKGEAYFYLGYAYGMLAFHWGDVILDKTGMTLEEAYAATRSPKSEVVAYSMECFDKAAQMLPATYGGVQRATKGMAYSFKARIAMYNGDYATAATAAKACMDLGVYSLHENYQDLFIAGNSPEWIFVFKGDYSLKQYYWSASDCQNYAPRLIGGWGTCGPSYELVFAYPCTDGLPVDESPLYNPKAIFDHRDPRMAMTIAPFAQPESECVKNGTYKPEDYAFCGYEFTPSPLANKVKRISDGAMVFNTEVLFQILDSLFRGVNFLIWLVGIGTLLAGAIGVSNIMMVTVRERTTEIGIRRAIGATPKMILSQIISESIVLTLVAGMSGILFAVAILQMLELGNTEDGIVNAHFQVHFWTAILAAVVISMMGVLAGLAPAWRAMSIKPVDAMRDE